MEGFVLSLYGGVNVKKVNIVNKNEVLKMSNIESNLFTKECIRTALLSLMAVKTFEQITVTEVIKKAGVSRGGFYRNYQSKEDVLQEICEDLFKYMLSFVTDHKFYENPRQWYVDFFRNIAENQEGYQLLMNAQAPKNVVLKFDEERILRELQRDDSVLEHYRAVALARALPEIILIWVRNGTKETPEEMAEMMLEIFYIKP